VCEIHQDNQLKHVVKRYFDIFYVYPLDKNKTW